VKCSLLTLSTFVDDELPAERHSEVDAHLVGCPRCSAGAATLREEKDRVSHLARLSVDAVSAQSLLEQIGIAVEQVAPPSETQVTSPPPHVDNLRSEGGRGGASLPWTPTQADDGPTANQEVTVPAVSPDTQPDLPLDGVRSVPASWNRASTPPPVGDERGAAGAAATAVPAATSAARWAPATDEWPDPLPPKTSWEAALPPPLDSVSHGDDAWGTPQLPVAVPAAMPPAPPPPPPQSPSRPLPPTKLASASGPARLWTRVRDAAGVRLALSRGVDAADDGVQIINGGPGSRGATLASAPIALASDVASAPPPARVATAPARAAEDVELPGTVQRPSLAADPATAVSRRGADSAVDAPSHRWVRRARGDSPSADDESEWNAFAASSFPLDEAAVERTREVPAKQLGRHSRAVSRQNVPFTTQVSRVLARMAAAVRTQGAAAAATVRRGIAGVSRAGPNSRLYAVVAGIGLVFVAALLFARSSPHTAPATALRPAPTDAVAQPHHPAAAAGPSSGAVAQSAPPAATNVQTFGSGATGYQVLRMRYGVQAAYLRVVFDLGSAGGAAAGSPKVVVSFTGPQTMLVTFTGALPAGSTGVPPPGKVISSVTLLSSANQKTVYRFQLTRPVSTVGFYLASPTRFVLDLH